MRPLHTTTHVYYTIRVKKARDFSCGAKIFPRAKARGSSSERQALRRYFIDRHIDGAVQKVSALSQNTQYRRCIRDLHRHAEGDRCGVGRRVERMLHNGVRDGGPVLLQFKDDIQRETYPGCRRKVSVESRSVDPGLGKRKIAVSRCMRDCCSRRNAVDIEQQGIPRRSRSRRCGICGKKLRCGRRSRGSRRSGRSRRTCCAGRPCRSRGAGRSRCASGACCAGRPCRPRGAGHTCSRCPGCTRRHSNLWGNNLLFRLSGLTGALIAGQFIVYMDIADIRLAVSFPYRYKIYKLNTHFTSQGLAVRIPF